MTFDLVVRGGTVVTERSQFVGDVAITDGVIAAVAQANTLADAVRTIDVSGQLVLPGLVDPHVHLAHKVFLEGEWVRAADDITTGTRAGALGGCTTVIDFALQRDKDPVTTVAERRQECAADAVIDFGLHAVLTGDRAETAMAVAPLTADGVPSFKLYMIYRKQGRMADDALLWSALREADRAGAIIGVHAENAGIAESNTDELVRRGLTTARDFATAKPDYVEAEAINRAIFLAEEAGAALYVFHLSTRKGLDLIRSARARGVRVFAETCTHYLTLTEACYERPDGHRYICSPPLRSSSDADALWTGLSDETITVVSSDHCGFDGAAKDRSRSDFTKVPNGLPGVDLRLPMMYTEGYRSGRLSLSQLAALLSSNPARVFGLFPKKGVLLPGSDADLVVIDPDAARPVDADETAPGWSPYAGRTLQGWPTITISRGEVIAEAGKCVAPAGRGRFVARALTPS